MSIIQILLFPFTILYKWITDFRNHLYNIGYKKSFQFQTKVINVGNLTVGGTGKTPHVEYLIKLLQNQFKIATLSRGYGRKSKGFILADENADAIHLGDEPMQFFKKFGHQVAVSVCEDRVEAIPKILFEVPETQVILLDDAFQHRAVQPNFNILLTDFRRLFYKDFPFPSGRLRESRRGAKRADCVIVSKCPLDLSQDAQKVIQRQIAYYTRKDTPVFFSGIKYGEPVAVFGDDKVILSKQMNLISIAGIAQPQIFINHLQGKANILENIIYKDHHHFLEKDIRHILKIYTKFKTQNPVLLTTEKDFVKLSTRQFEPLFQSIPFFYLPIEIIFLDKKDEFEKMIFNIL